MGNAAASGPVSAVVHGHGFRNASSTGCWHERGRLGVLAGRAAAALACAPAARVDVLRGTCWTKTSRTAYAATSHDMPAIHTSAKQERVADGTPAHGPRTDSAPSLLRCGHVARARGHVSTSAPPPSEAPAPGCKRAVPASRADRSRAHRRPGAPDTASRARASSWRARRAAVRGLLAPWSLHAQVPSYPRVVASRPPPALSSHGVLLARLPRREACPKL